MVEQPGELAHEGVVHTQMIEAAYASCIIALRNLSTSVMTQILAQRIQVEAHNLFQKPKVFCYKNPPLSTLVSQKLNTKKEELERE